MRHSKLKHKRAVQRNFGATRKPAPAASRGHWPVICGAFALVLAFALAGHYMGRNASAHNAAPDDMAGSLSTPISALVAKGSLLPGGGDFDLMGLPDENKQDFFASGKSDFALKSDMPEVESTVVPVSVNLQEEPPEVLDAKPEPDLPKVKAVAKPKEKPVEKQKVIAARRVKLAEENCLARAIYFEARSETELGQLAVAKVILNRKNDPDFPKTICGVVYQGSGRRNSCQFSFACDGLPDDVKQPAAWANAKRIAQKSIAGDQSVQAIGTATNYHADYVKPKWAKSMRRLIKIGRHIFYADT